MERGVRLSKLSQIVMILGTLLLSCFPVFAEVTVSLANFSTPGVSYSVNASAYSSFQAVPPNAPWLLVSSATHFDANDIGTSKGKMHPALKSFLRFFIVSVGTFPIAVGLSSVLYLYPPLDWTISKQTEIVLISGATAAVTVALIDMIIDLVLQEKKKKGLSVL